MADEGFDATADLVADRPDMVEILACGVVEHPVFVAFAGILRAGVAATHGDHDIRSFDRLGGQDLGSFGGNIDPFLCNCLHGDRIDLVRGVPNRRSGLRFGRPTADLR